MCAKERARECARERAREREKGCEGEIAHVKERHESLFFLLHSRALLSLCVRVQTGNCTRTRNATVPCIRVDSLHEIISQRTALAHAVDDERRPVPPHVHVVGRCLPKRGSRFFSTAEFEFRAGADPVTQRKPRRERDPSGRGHSSR